MKFADLDARGVDIEKAGSGQDALGSGERGAAALVEMLDGKRRESGVAVARLVPQMRFAQFQPIGRETLERLGGAIGDRRLPAGKPDTGQRQRRGAFVEVRSCQLDLLRAEGGQPIAAAEEKPGPPPSISIFAALSDRSASQALSTVRSSISSWPSRLRNAPRHGLLW